MSGAGNTDDAADFTRFGVFHQRPDRKVRCFLSHSLDEPAALDSLKAALPPHVEGVTFPRVTEALSDALSKALLEKIGSCDVLVYPRGGRSDTSLWVNFERRYARRLKIQAYSFDPSSKQLEEFTEEPHNIIIPLMIRYRGEDDDTRVYKVLQWLLFNRNVTSTIVSLPREDHGGFHAQRWQEATSNMNRVALEFHATSGNAAWADQELWNFYRALKLGGTVVLFLTNAACEVAWPHADLYLEVLARDGGDPAFDRPKIVWMEPPDARQIEAAFDRLGERPDNFKFRAAVRKSIDSLVVWKTDQSSRPLDNGTPLWRPLMLGQEGDAYWQAVDTLLIDLEFVAQRRKTRAADFRFEHHEQAAKREARQAVERMQKAMRNKTISNEDL